MKRQLLLLVSVLWGAPFIVRAQAKITAPPIKTGIYTGLGDFTIGFENGKLKGAFLYLDNWDNEVKGYMREDYFFIEGTSSDGKVYKITAYDGGFPDQRTTGLIYYNSNASSIKVILKTTREPAIVSI